MRLFHLDRLSLPKPYIKTAMLIFRNLVTCSVLVANAVDGDSSQILELESRLESLF